MGALLLGGALSLLHTRLNALTTPAAVASTLAFFAVLYGLVAALVFGFGWLALALLSRSRRDRYPTWPAWGGFFALSAAFFEPFFLYGLTYDQAWPVKPATAIGMLWLLLGLGLTIAVALAALSWLLARVFTWLDRRRLLLQAVLVLAILDAALHLGLIGLVDEASLPAAASAAELFVTLDEPPGAAEERQPKVVLVGLDGAEPRVLERLIAEGALPFLARARERGAYGHLATLKNANSAVIWASLYTGLEPSEHSVHDFYRVHLPGPAALYPVHRTFFKELTGPLESLGVVRRIPVNRHSLRAAPPLWEIALDAGLTIGVVDGYFYSLPAIELDTDESFFLAYGSNGFARRLAGGTADLSELEFFVQPKEIFPVVREDLSADDFTWQSRTLLELLETHEQPRLLSFYCHQPDAIQHESFRTLEPERYLSPGPTQGSGPVVDMYRAFDRFLADLDPFLEPGTAVLIVSDHGHSPTILHSMDTQHRHGPPGIALFYGGPVREGATLTGAHILDIFPTTLKLLGLPQAEDTPGRILTEAFTEELNQQPTLSVPSYRGLPPLVKALDSTRNYEKEEIEKLKRLGYL